MKRSTSVILGIPVDAVTMQEAVEHVFHLAETYPSDRRTRLACIVDLGVMTSTMSGDLRQVRRPVLLSLLRGADLVVPGDEAVAQAGRYLGPGLKGHVVEADLVQGLAREGALRGRSLYLLGGAPGAAGRAAAILRDSCPGLCTAGSDLPPVSAGVPGRTVVPGKEGATVEMINRASPDLLFIPLGAPGRELFFEQNRHRLKVPVIIGMSADIDLKAGPDMRTPLWRRLAEGLLSHVRTPLRMGKRSLHDLPKFWRQVWPSVFLYQYTKRVAPHAYLKKCKNGISYKYLTRGREQVLLLTMPGSVDAEAVPRLASLIPRRPTAHLVLDVGDVAFIDSAGLGLLLSTVHLWEGSRHTVLITGATPYGKKVLSTSGLYDLLGHRLCASLDEALTRLDALAVETSRAQATTMKKNLL